MSDEGKDLYVSAVPGHLVTRYGTGTLIGAARGVIEKPGDVVDPSQVTYDEQLVVRIPEAEHARYRREYGRALRDGALKLRSKADFEACNAKIAAASKADGDKIASDKAKAEAEAKAKSGKKE